MKASNWSTVVLLEFAIFLLAKITLFAFRHIFHASDIPLAEHGDWAYLWDDAKNFHANAHLRRPALTWSNVRWAWEDGQILGVWEPISLMMKMVLHDMIDFTRTEGEFAGPRVYRILSAYWHTLNVILAFLVGLAFVRSVNDYGFVRDCLEKRLKDAEDKANPSYQQMLSDLRHHELYSAAGLWLGTMAFFAVHPLQAQTVGWISCVSYIFSCTFALLSFWGYVVHRDIMRRWRRHLRGGGRLGEVPGPFRIGMAVASSPNSSNRRKRMGEKGKRGSSGPALPAEDGHETLLFTAPKLLSLASYICATLCKSPAVTLPLVFIIVDVFIYSYPLSREAPGDDKDDATGKRKGCCTNSQSGIAMLLPNNVFTKFRAEAFPKLWNLTVRAILSWLPLLLTAFVVTVFIVRGNTKHLLDVQTPYEKVEKSVWALSWYASKIICPTYLVAAVEKMSFSFWDRWEVALSLVVVPYFTLVVLAHSTSGAAGRVLAGAYGSFVAILLPSLGLIQHGRLFLAADR